MLKRKISVSLLFLGLLLNLMLLSQAAADQDARPSLAGVVPFFYYNNIEEAADWYENKLGFKKLTDEGWVVIFEITPSGYLGLVNASGGTLRPIEDKGALLSIETAELEAWHERLKDVEGINMVQGIVNNDNGLIEEFRLVDPGGYVIEFFRWREHRVESERYSQ